LGGYAIAVRPIPCGQNQTAKNQEAGGLSRKFQSETLPLMAYNSYV
jgi:hypothetical protein